MSYNLTPITAKIKRTTKGGITQPLLNVGGPVKMKASVPAPAKNTSNRQKANESRKKSRAASDLQKAEAIKANKLKKANELSSKEFITNKRGRKVKNPDYKTAGTTTASATTKKSGFAGDTPYTVSNGKGTIHGPKSSYDDAYKKRNKKVYGEMSKSQFIKESKRQTKVFKETGKWDAPKAKRTKAVTVSAITPTSVKPTKTVSIEAKINPAELKPKVTKVNTKKADPSKREVRKTRKINKKLAQAAEARAKGNEKKALRKEKAAMRKAARLAKKNK